MAEEEPGKNGFQKEGIFFYHYFSSLIKEKLILSNSQF